MRGQGLCLIVVAVWLGVPRPAQSAPDSSYYVYVCAESDDEVALVRYGPDGLRVVKTIVVGRLPAETEGPHGIRVDPDGEHWYVSIAHGLPFGSVHKYETGSDLWRGDVSVGMFPATLDVSATTGLLYVVNFDLHGPMDPSTVSVVEADTMTEVARVPTGVMPHGSRFGVDGLRHYSVSMMDDELVEIDALDFEVTRTLRLEDATVQPTWVAPTAEGRLYVAGNASNRIYEVGADDWRVIRSFESGPGPYNLDVTPDGTTLVVTYKKGAAVGFWDVPTGTERARVTTTRSLPHGVVVTPDGRYAFVTVEGVGSEPGTVEVYEVASGRRLDAVDIGKQAGGIDFWKID